MVFIRRRLLTLPVGGSIYSSKAMYCSRENNRALLENCESPCAKSTGRLIIWLFILYVLDLRNSSLRQERREFLRVIKGGEKCRK
jgi:hypothetical protein